MQYNLQDYLQNHCYAVVSYSTLTHLLPLGDLRSKSLDCWKVGLSSWDYPNYQKNKGKWGLLAIKIDMSKAYDRIEWCFLRTVLELNGFRSHFINLIMHCVSSVSYQILLNGSPLRAFKPQWGLRQGDPLLTYLFILCSDVRLRLMTKKEQEGKIHGIQIARHAPAVSHLMFSDDTLLFCRAKENEVAEINDCLSCYCWSGQFKQKKVVDSLLP